MTNPVTLLFFCAAGCRSVVSEAKRGHRNRVKIVGRVSLEVLTQLLAG
jgi:hypothetical protein